MKVIRKNQKIKIKMKIARIKLRRVKAVSHFRALIDLDLEQVKSLASILNSSSTIDHLMQMS